MLIFMLINKVYDFSYLSQLSKISSVVLQLFPMLEAQVAGSSSPLNL